MTGSRPKFDGYPAGTRAGQVAALAQERRIAARFTSRAILDGVRQAGRLLTCECERSENMGVVQAFQLLTGELLHEMLIDPDNRIGELLKKGVADAEIVETLYLTAFSRRPTATEIEGIDEVDRRGEGTKRTVELGQEGGDAELVIPIFYRDRFARYQGQLFHRPCPRRRRFPHTPSYSGAHARPRTPLTRRFYST